MSIWFKVFLGLLSIYKLAVFFWLPLIDDETYHWTWSQILELSYFDHPGMIAWAEAISTGIFGNNKVGIRFPALTFYVGTLVLMYRVFKDAFNQRTAEVGILLFAVAPLWGLSSFVAAPELPFVFFWWLALYVFWNGVKWEKPVLSPAKMWILLGFVFGAGINSKFPIFLLALGMGLYLLFDPRNRRQLFMPWPYLGLLIAGVCALPIFIWNSQHDWATFVFQFQRRHQGGGGFDLARYGQFLGYQAIFMSPGIYIGLILGGVLALKNWFEQKYRFFLLLALPTIMVFYYQALFAEFKPHWSGPGYMTLIVLVAALWYEGLKFGQWSVFKEKSRIWFVFASLFLVLINFITWGPIFVPSLVPQIYALTKDPATYQPRFDFSNELFGWSEAGQRALDKQRELKAEGIDVVLSAKRYETVSQMTYYTRQTIWQLSREVDQFWFWQSEEDRKKLHGKSLIFVANDKYDDDPMNLAYFDKCELEELKTYRGSIHSRTFKLYLCSNFQGLK